MIKRNLFTGKNRWNYQPILRDPFLFEVLGGAAFGVVLALMLWVAI